jgi:hypothetical protein
MVGGVLRAEGILLHPTPGMSIDSLGIKIDARLCGAWGAGSG